MCLPSVAGCTGHEPVVGIDDVERPGILSLVDVGAVFKSGGLFLREADENAFVI